jgi:NADPH2:quinone reductase
MKAWQVRAHGGPEALTLDEVPLPVPAAGEMLVRVAAAGLNFSDLLMVAGRYQVKPPLPFIPGQEVAGVVERCDSGAFRRGERVASKVTWGGFAEAAAVRDDMAFRLPEAIDLACAATLPVVWPTAWIALFERARLQAGERILILAAAGGTGLAALQLAKAAGAHVIAAAGNPGKFALCREHGADEVLDYSVQGWAEKVRGVDVIFDPVGGELTDVALKALGRGGRLLVVGFSSGAIPAIRANRLLLKNASALGVYWSHELDAPLLERAFADMWRRHASGSLRFFVGRRYAFEELPQALRDIAARRTAGKSVLTIS